MVKTTANGKQNRKIRDGERTRAKLIKAATIEFSRKGLLGARTADIAKRAGTNHFAVFHHFATKDRLFTAVIAELFDRTWDEAVSEKIAALHPEQAIEFLYHHLAATVGSDQTAFTILTDLNTHRGRHLKSLPGVTEYFRRVIEELAAIVKRGEKMGIFRKGIDPALLYILINGAQEIFVKHAYTLSMVIERDQHSQAAKNAWRKFLFDFVIHGLRK